MIELAILAGLAVSFGLVYVLFNCVCLPFPRKRTGFSTFDNTTLDAETGGNYSLYTSHDVSGDSSRVTFEPLPDILAKTVAATALKPRITCIDNERQKLAAKSVSVFKPFPRSQLMYVKELGIGWFGQVLEGDADKITINSNRSRVVIKLLKDDATPYEQHLFLEEAAPYRELDHPNVVKLLGLCTESVPFLTILEQSAYGDLKTYLIRHKREAEAMVRRGMLIKCLLDMSAGLACLHRHGYVHHDFACRNCLLMGDMSVKIGDYGISEDKFREEYYDTGQDLLPVRWMAPETLTQNGNIWQVTKFTKEANIWSFGVAMWEVIELEKLPYFSMSDEDVLQKVVADKKIKLPISHSSGVQKQKLNEVMQFCWLDARNRPSIEDIHRLIDQIKQDTGSKKEDFDTKWEKLTAKDSRIVKVEVHTSAQNKITRIDTDFNTIDLKKQTSTDISKISDTSPIVHSKDSGIPKSELSEGSSQKFPSTTDEVINDTFVMVNENSQRPTETTKNNFLNNVDLGLSSEPITPISSSSSRRTYQLTSTPVSVERPSASAAASIQNDIAKELRAEAESQSPVQAVQETDVVDSIIETPKQNNEKNTLNLDKNEINKVKRILLTDTEESSDQPSDLNVPKIKVVKEVDGELHVDNKDVPNSANVDYYRCESIPESVDSKNGEVYDTSDIEYVLEGGDIRIREINNDDDEDDKNDQVKLKQLKLSIADAFSVNNQKFDNERRNSDPESPDDYETLVAKEIYMSKGTTIPPTRHTTPRSLTTIPEDSIATNDMSGPGLRFIEPLEDSLFTSSVQDSFEWDDYIGEQLVGHVKNSENSPRQSMEFQDWTLDQDSSQESDSQNNSKMEDSNKLANGSSSSSISTPYSSSDSEDDEGNNSVITEKSSKENNTEKETDTTITELNAEKGEEKNKDKIITDLITEKEGVKNEDKSNTDLIAEKEENNEGKPITELITEKEEEKNVDKTITELITENEEEEDQDKTITEQNVEDMAEGEEDTTITN